MLAFLVAFGFIVTSVFVLERGKTDADAFEIGGVVAIPYLIAAIALLVMEYRQLGDWAAGTTVAVYYILTFVLLWRVLLIPALRSLLHIFGVFTVWSALILISDLPLGAA